MLLTHAPFERNASLVCDNEHAHRRPNCCYLLEQNATAPHMLVPICLDVFVFPFSSVLWLGVPPSLIMVCCSRSSQFRLLLWKNYVLKKRRCTSTLSECLIPCVAFLVLVILRAVVHVQDQEMTIAPAAAPVTRKHNNTQQRDTWKRNTREIQSEEIEIDGI